MDLYKIGLEIKLVVENGRIQEGVFGNIALLGCHAGEFEWTEKFMEDYQSFLKEDIRADIVALNKGLWYFHQEAFKEAYNEFVSHSFSSFYQISVRSNTIRAIYELFLKDESLYELLEAQILAYEKFLHRNALISVALKEAHLNQLFILKRLTSGLFNRKDLKTLQESLFTKLNKMEKVIGKKWLNEKITQLNA